MISEADQITKLLLSARGGQPEAAEQLMQIVYSDLKGIAHRHMGRERADHTLQPTALVHEAYLRIFGKSSVDWQNRAQFFAVAAKQMRCVLLDHAREVKAVKRGSGLKVSLTDEHQATPAMDCDVAVVNELLERLQRLDPNAAKVVELKFFAGCADREVAEVLGTSTATVRRHWEFARAWLARAMRG